MSPNVTHSNFFWGIEKLSFVAVMVQKLDWRVLGDSAGRTSIPEILRDALLESHSGVESQEKVVTGESMLKNFNHFFRTPKINQKTGSRWYFIKHHKHHQIHHFT